MSDPRVTVIDLDGGPVRRPRPVGRPPLLPFLIGAFLGGALVWALVATGAGPTMDLEVGSVRVVAASPADAVPSLYTVSGEGVEVSPLPDIKRARLDVSGSFIAGLAPAEPERGGDLLVGPVDGELRLVADRVRSLAWHDTEPGTLAYVDPAGEGGDGELVTWMADGTETRSPTDVGNGSMYRFGEWGFAVSRPGREFRTVAYRAEGALVGDFVGYPAGAGPGGRLVLATEAPASANDRGSVRAFAVTSTSRTAPIEWLAAGQLPARITPSPDRQRFAVHLSGPSAGELGEVVVVDALGAPQAFIARTATPTASAWSRDGRYLVVAGRAAGDRIELVTYDTDDGSIERSPIDDIDPGIVVWDLAIPDD